MKKLSIKGILFGYVTSLVINCLIGIPIALTIYHYADDPYFYRTHWIYMLLMMLIGKIGVLAGAFITCKIAPQYKWLNGLLFGLLFHSIYLIDSIPHGKFLEKGIIFELSSVAATYAVIYLAYKYDSLQALSE